MRGMQGTLRVLPLSSFPLPMGRQEAFLFQLQHPLLQQGTQGKDPTGHEIFRAEDALPSSDIGYQACHRNQKRKEKVGKKAEKWNRNKINQRYPEAGLSVSSSWRLVSYHWDLEQQASSSRYCRQYRSICLPPSASAEAVRNSPTGSSIPSSTGITWETLPTTGS